MTNRIALVLGLAVVFLIVLDFLIFGGESSVFLSKKLNALIEWIAFWR